MKWNISIILIALALMLRCSSLGSFGDVAGGGVIGNPLTSTLSYTDTIHCKVVTKSGGQPPGTGGATLSPLIPFGADSARINQQQQYCTPEASGIKRFRFATSDGEQISSWSPDSAIAWTWTTAGICSVQVQRVEKTDTTTWSDPLIVKIIE
jgi:hypothetical protein